MPHVVLLGDSIFDNARYVPGGPSVIEHLKRCLPAGWTASLLALDGSVAEDVARQLARVPSDATHLVVSVGGNNALGVASYLLNKPVSSISEALFRLGEIGNEFRRLYRAMLQDVLALGRPTALCTIYDAIPGLELDDRTGLALFNEIILREAVRSALPLIDLRLVCHETTDYSPVSPIEPSVSGGGKIARIISRVVTEHDFASPGCRVYAALSV
jgi:hypothetical protein